MYLSMGGKNKHELADGWDGWLHYNFVSKQITITQNIEEITPGSIQFMVAFGRVGTSQLTIKVLCWCPQ